MYLVLDQSQKNHTLYTRQFKQCETLFYRICSFLWCNLTLLFFYCICCNVSLCACTIFLGQVPQERLQKHSSLGEWQRELPIIVLDQWLEMLGSCVPNVTHRTLGASPWRATPMELLSWKQCLVLSSTMATIEPQPNCMKLQSSIKERSY